MPHHQAMSAAPSSEAPKPLRLWPGIVVVVLQSLVRFGIPVVAPDALPLAIFGGLIGGLLVLAWWIFFSRAPRFEKWSALIVMIIALTATFALLHESVATGMMGMMFAIYVTPILSLALVAWAAATRHLTPMARRVSMVVTLFLACGVFALLRTGGITGDAESDFHWRWAKTPEERLLARSADEPTRKSASTTNQVAASWPGFRGAERDGVIHGARIATNWSSSPPVELWRRPVGPAWSSFAVSGEVFYTQEQRGEGEVVACYYLANGEPKWRHRDAARFWESNAGAGPRATPTLHSNRVYTLGATGILNSLDAENGSVVWSRNATENTAAKTPGWGFAGSPLVLDEIVIVSLAGTLAAYDLATGKPSWVCKVSTSGYSSPHLATIKGSRQVLLLNGAGIISVEPKTGSELWKHSWRGDGIVQPALTTEGDVLLGTGSGIGGGKMGVRRISVTNGPGGWTTEERWTSNGLKPYYNDFVVHKGHAFGFDGSLLACIDLTDGKRKWKGGRYGHGQLILLADQDLLLVLSERGELVLVAAASDEFAELARVEAIKGKTWNHPVLVEDILLARNSEEMVAFRLFPATQ